MKNIYTLPLTIILLSFSFITNAQNIGINGTGATPDASAMLDISSTDKGMLVPRMTLAQRNLIAAPATGLLIYQTDAVDGFWYYDGTAWINLSTGSDNDWDGSGSGKMYTTNLNDNVGIGESNPSHKLVINKNTSDALFLSLTNSTTGNLGSDGFQIGMNASEHALIRHREIGNHILFQTESTERMRIKNNGVIGIGTNVPTGTDVLLDVNGKMKMRNGATAGYVPVSDADGIMTWTDPNSIGNDWSKAGNTGTNAGPDFIGTTDNVGLAIKTNNINRIRVLNTGVVGIANVNPSGTDVKLDVNGKIKMRTGSALGYVPVSDANGIMTWTDPSTLGVDLIDADGDTKIDVEATVDNDSIRFYTPLNGGASTEFFNMSNGRLGIINTGGSVFIGGGAGENDDLSSNYNTFTGFSAGRNNITGERNTAIGFSSLRENTTGKYNTAIGMNSLRFNDVGEFNTASGYNALYANTSGNYNTAAGNKSLKSNTTGVSNTAIGNAALFNNTEGNKNVAIGDSTLVTNITGNSNTAIGVKALSLNTVNGNTAIGASAGQQNTTGTNITAIGNRALLRNTTGSNNMAVGSAALNKNTTGEKNTANGSLALFSNTVGNVNTAIGFNAQYLNVSGNANTAIGNLSLRQNAVGSGNTAIGNLALFNNKASGNTAVGDSTLRTNSTGRYNTAIGKDALKVNLIGSANTANGAEALLSNTGDFNTAIGRRALYDNTSGEYNTASGSGALYSNTIGYNNTATGFDALYTNISGRFNTANGYMALNANSTGHGNTALGYESMIDNSSGSFNTAIGYRTSTLTFSTNASAIGAYASAILNNTLILGSINGVNGGTVDAKVGIGTNIPNALLTVDGAANKPGGGTWSTFSDQRLKKNIKLYTDGLEQVLKIVPKTFQYNDKAGISDTEKEYVGIIAQDIQKIAPYMVKENGIYNAETKEEDIYLEYDASALSYMIVNATQEQQKIIEDQQKQIDELKQLVNSLLKK